MTGNASIRSRASRWTLALALLVACSSDQLRFDEPRPDAAVERPARDGGGWRPRDDCSAGSCGIECSEETTCDGTCADGCRAECERASRCTLAAGGGAFVTCEAATCALAIGTASEVFCAAGATCTVRCLGACTVTCSSSSHCSLQCPAGEAAQVVTGAASCP